MPFKDLVRKSLLQYFDKLNTKYSRQGLTFNVYENHYWIEIKINPSAASAYRQDQAIRREDFFDEEDEKEPFTDTNRVLNTDMDDGGTLPLRNK